MVVVVVMREPLRQHRPQVEVWNAERACNVGGSSIDEAQESVQYLEAVKDADCFLPRHADAAVPEARFLLGCIRLLEPRLPHDQHAIRTLRRPAQHAAKMVLEVGRSEERRVGKEGRCGRGTWCPSHS